jgi:hypothetical protein
MEFFFSERVSSPPIRRYGQPCSRVGRVTSKSREQGLRNTDEQQGLFCSVVTETPR